MAITSLLQSIPPVTMGKGAQVCKAAGEESCIHSEGLLLGICHGKEEENTAFNIPHTECSSG
jgi:hypothetical protein